MKSNYRSNQEIFFSFIGTGNAFAEGGRFNAGYWLTINKDKPNHTLIDCGPTTLAGIKKFNLPFAQLHRILISHYHGDHFAGLPFLLLDRAYLTSVDNNFSSSNKFQIYGPVGLEERIKRLIHATYPSQYDVLIGLCEFKVIDPEKHIKFPEYFLKSKKANHSEQAIMYRIEFKDTNNSIIYTGDNEMLLDQFTFFENSDILVTECTTFESQNGNHTSLKFIKDNISKFNEFNIKKVYLTHLGSEVYNKIDIDLPPNVHLATDGLKISL